MPWMIFLHKTDHLVTFHYTFVFSPCFCGRSSLMIFCLDPKLHFNVNLNDSIRGCGRAPSKATWQKWPIIHCDFLSISMIPKANWKSSQWKVIKALIIKRRYWVPFTPICIYIYTTVSALITKNLLKVDERMRKKYPQNVNVGDIWTKPDEML